MRYKTENTSVKLSASLVSFTVCMNVNSWHDDEIMVPDTEWDF